VRTAHRPTQPTPILIPPPRPPAPEAEAKADLLKQLGDFIQEKVVVADQVLAANAVSKVYDGDVVMTYSSSQVRV
jgi:translation initiation factor eIF-2B subunit delta